ncbi:Ribosomal RNA small subunit methyltransferase I [Cardiobacterium valvarum]|uniref:Ribosomal RNA small subunit methyltransferase I n=2 Tax=Cardiobacterium valvarum TaxID=194702 RepID=A0A381E4U5_9GAMM|nr:Ribosomal RNA small subunit methyltransferase I [Cardiobacterium valvarum]
MLLQIHLRRFADFLPLGGVDTGCGTDLRPCLATTHLDENQLRAIAGDEVNLAITGAKVVRYNDEPLRFQIGGGASFARPAATQMGSKSGKKHEGNPMSGTLYIVATPIGNLDDISRRALATLQAADIIACEDTRHSRRLLDAYAIDRPLTALHQHNERGAAEALIRRLQAGENVALVSDAGTPLVSDPGALLTRLAHEAGIRISPLPGASSVITALSASGLPADRFTFAGFIPAKAGERQRFLDDYRTAMHTTIFFEAPHRISETLATMAGTFDGARPLVIARELSKQFEQIAHLSVATAPAWLAGDDNRRRGEFVLLLGAAVAQTTADWQPLADDLRDAGLAAKTTAALVAKHTGANKKAVYQYLLDRIG